ncbi:PQQ-dependent catabolism-associated CXXCW motif protein [Bradyrhizobium erythrophlei]|uniref:PQQ-dependent catabolism-associated CXXCW motif protein n=2 Tax=Bradyrhizobium erythrophlei TaxID=1437360 RepID=A0A1H4UA41_9BRAD|nr:PQQ-dependent catabolism-associated CXXCW motif protein [Bradyrhizobium erythrophlei]
MLAVILLAASHVRAQDQPAEPEGYRTEDYRTAVPATLAGARVLTTAEAAEIWRNKSGAFVDVLPRAPKPNLPAGTVWRERPHRDIPGSIWLPDTGYGKLAASTEDYMRRGLVRASSDDKARLLVIYCQESCWMSWNAAKRVLSYGYRNVAWYPEGTDGWGRANLPLEDVEPEPREGEQ